MSVRGAPLEGNLIPTGRARFPDWTEEEDWEKADGYFKDNVQWVGKTANETAIEESGFDIMGIQKLRQRKSNL